MRTCCGTTYHHDINISQWERPLQDGWQAFGHEGKLWYFHAAIETSQWAPPTEDTVASCAEQALCHVCGIGSQERRCEGCEGKVCETCSHRKWGLCIDCGSLATIAELLEYDGRVSASILSLCGTIFRHLQKNKHGPAGSLISMHFHLILHCLLTDLIFLTPGLLKIR